MKLISVSKKKLVVHESCYVAPLSFTSDRLRIAIEQGDGQPGQKRVEEQRKPEQVQSVKSMRNHSIPVPNTKAVKFMRPPTQLDASADRPRAAVFHQCQAFAGRGQIHWP
jgi:hypothetical protein